VRGALRAARVEAEKRGSEFQVVHFKIEGNHLHLVVEARTKSGLSRGMAGLEIRIARAVNGAIGRKGKVFPDRYHRRDLGTPTEVRNVLSYVLNNARKHVRHIGRVAYVDVTSSGESFDGWSERVEMYRSLGDDKAPWPQVRAWTWLVRTGWRKRGLISPFAVPGAVPGTRAS
jgi:REP element-mobilizing transposase RayT